jgi:hypothetical protein
MKTTEIFVEQVLIGLLVLAIGGLPYWKWCEPRKQRNKVEPTLCQVPPLTSIRPNVATTLENGGTYDAGRKSAERRTSARHAYLARAFGFDLVRPILFF